MIIIIFTISLLRNLKKKIRLKLIFIAAKLPI